MILFNETRDGDIVHNVSVMYTEDTQLIQWIVQDIPSTILTHMRRGVSFNFIR